MRPWSDRPISDCREALLPLPADLLRLEPHPYVAVGAPYGSAEDPFRLRAGVVDRLLQAQTLLQQRDPGLRLAIFDAWRPLSVQAFMVEWSVAQEAQRLGTSSRRCQRDAPGASCCESILGCAQSRSRHPATP